LPDELLARSPAFANVITRSRYTEDALQAAVARGARQYILIGASFDSFALRLPDYARGNRDIRTRSSGDAAVKAAVEARPFSRSAEISFSSMTSMVFRLFDHA
jgi:DNA-binding NarL/FixJ family response regulator